MSYTYSATGEKLKKQSGVNGTTDYVNGIQYTNGAMDFIETEEGRYLKAGDGKFQYNLKDHLGNVRLMYEKATVTTPSTPVQENEYYAFGLNVARQDVSPANKYLYNGKELQNDYNLNQYDYGARSYDPVVARWGSVDPLAELERRASPYNYTFDNPIRHTDPDGMFGEDFNDDNDDEGPGPRAASAIGITTTAPSIGSMIIEGIKDLGSSLLQVGRFGVNVSAATAGAVGGTVGLVFLPAGTGTGDIPPPRKFPLLPPPISPSMLNSKDDANKQKGNTPGQTTSGHPTDAHGNKLGPNGKAQVDVVKHASQKRAKDAARNEGKGAPIKHTNPTKGGDHYHPTDEDGEKKPTSTHHEY